LSSTKISLIITTFNWPEALKATLGTGIRQSLLPYEIIVADDGSGPETARAVQKVLGSSRARWCHVRQEDAGIRQGRVKNLGVKYSTGSYLIFIDHDVLMHPDFIADHKAAAEPDVFLQGKRCFLPETYTKSVLASHVFVPPSSFLRGLENRKNAVRAPKIGRILGRPRNFQTSLRGCNLSMSRRDFLKVDGYDEVFDQLWGREDSDICYRLFHSGVRCKNLWFSALQYHLYHPVTKNRERDRLDDELDRIRREKRKQACKGFSQTSSEGEIIAGGGGF
jgi:GT2 family glycosyltransferase